MAASTAAKPAPLPETHIPRPAAPQKEPRFYYGASYFFPLLDAVASKDLSYTDFVLCMVIARCVREDNKNGWVWKSEKEIAQEAAMTYEGIRSALRNPLARHVIEQGKEEDIWGRRCYRLPLRSQWIAVKKRIHKLKADPVKPKQTRLKGTAHIGSKSWVRPFCESKAIALGASPLIVFERGDGSRAATIQLAPGSAEFRWPTGSAVMPERQEIGSRSLQTTGATDGSQATAKALREQGEVVPGHRPSTGTAVVPRHQDTGSSPPPAEVHTGSNLGSRRVPILDDRGEPICGPEGALIVDVEEDRSLYASPREEKSVLRRSPSAIFAHFLGKKGTHPRWEPLPAQPKRPPEREQIRLKNGPTGIWDRMKHQIESAAISSPLHIDPHTFGTWIRPTREEGAKADGTMVIRVPSSRFRKRLSEIFRDQIGRAFAIVTGEKTETPLLQYVAEGEVEIFPPPTAARCSPEPLAKEACAK